jgi:predicted GNAT superfamily acetyltransferase
MIEIRQLASQEDFANAVKLQQRIWGFAEIDLLPVRLFVVASKIGGHSFGAFDDGRMVGFCLALPGLKPGGQTYLHSHMLGILPGYRDQGLGRKLKLAQRQDAIARGIALMEWTFDPLELKNAYFNLERLGAIVRRYVFNQYGITTSRLHGGLPTDRCIAEWWLSHPRVEAVLAGQPAPHGDVQKRIPVPNQIGTLRRDDPAAARAIQKRVGEEFTAAFREGLAAVGLERGQESSTYLLAPWPLK